MAESCDGETLIPLRVATGLFPTSPPPHIATVVRWALHGVGRPRVLLQTFVVGGRRYTTQGAVDRFIQRRSGEAAGLVQASSDRAGAISDCNSTLKAHGFGAAVSTSACKSRGAAP